MTHVPHSDEGVALACTDHDNEAMVSLTNEGFSTCVNQPLTEDIPLTTIISCIGSSGLSTTCSTCVGNILQQLSDCLDICGYDGASLVNVDSSECQECANDLSPTATTPFISCGIEIPDTDSDIIGDVEPVVKVSAGLHVSWRLVSIALTSVLFIAYI